MVGTLSDEKKDATGFGKRLKTLRLAAGLTQGGLGDLAGMLHQNIARLERGARTPTWETVLKLAEALNVTPDSFLESPDESATDDDSGDSDSGTRDKKPRGSGGKK